MYKIHEIETNVTYDDEYNTYSEAEDIVAEYERDDEESGRSVTYIIINTEE